MDERFATDLRAGYPDDVPGVVLGSPMLDGEVLSAVRVRLPLSTVNRHGGTIIYKVCEYNTTVCSNTASVTF